ncbi:cytochrome d ubiquinol oxidase, subunit II [Mycobacterium kansasii]|uniref:Cytochrome d ubiquinol oxidase, subunit II n=1 Tax=Mycobacterium kansasii TaxID=1768 RepID=A0A1V3WI67_MYCKA|nr:cytochrome d ubiquinol oxidase, subunit II [Mycobacterium kansasii]
MWFAVIGVLFLGFLVLEGFDFGVGMLMEPLARVAPGDSEIQRRAVLNTIGPVWDGNEVWLLTAGAGMFAAFPGWYATVFSALYLPLLAILFGMILRAVAIEWRGKVDDTKWRAWADFGVAAGLGCRGAVGRRVRHPGARTPGRRRWPHTSGHRRCAQRLHTAGRSGHRRVVPAIRRGVHRLENRRADPR